MQKTVIEFIRYPILMVLICGLYLPGWTQNALTVTGKVANPDGEGLPGATVVVKGTTNGTTTDLNGSYTISVPESSDVLVFSFIGFATQEIPLNGRTTLNVTLEEDAPYLDEVVVVGYGTMRRRDVMAHPPRSKGMTSPSFQSHPLPRRSQAEWLACRC
jgi:hypothetical protein